MTFDLATILTETALGYRRGCVPACRTAAMSSTVFELPGCDVHHQVVGVLVGERQAAAVEPVESEEGG